MSAALIVLIIVLAGLFALFALGLVLPVRFRIRIRYSPRSLKHEVAVKFPLIPLFLRIPVGRRKKDKPAGTVPAGAPDDMHTITDRARAIVNSARAGLEVFRGMYPKILKALGYAISGTTIEQFRLAARLGTGDASEAAMLVGGLRSLSGIGLSLAYRAGVRFAERPRVSVIPVFDRPYAAFDLRTEISVIPWRALRCALILLREWKKLKRRSRAAVSNAPGWNTRP